MHVNHYKQTAFGEGPVLVMLVQEGDAIGTDKWNYFYDEIEGFDYHPGFVYDIQVRKKKVKNPPQDASSIKYTLVKVISQEAANPSEEFDIKLKWEGTNFVGMDGANQFSLLYQYNINCYDLCDDLKYALENEEAVTGTFLHDGDGSLKLVSL